MVTIRVPATLNPNGELEYQLPADLPQEDFELVLDVKHATQPDASAELTDDERRDMLNFEGKTAGEILASGVIGAGAEDWKHVGEDSGEWVAEQRLKRREERQARWKSS
jgi:hypothetical protein